MLKKHDQLSLQCDWCGMYLHSYGKKSPKRKIFYQYDELEFRQMAYDLGWRSYQLLPVILGRSTFLCPECNKKQPNQQ